MSTFVLGSLVVTGFAYLANIGRPANLAYADKAQRIEEDIQAMRDKLSAQQI